MCYIEESAYRGKQCGNANGLLSARHIGGYFFLCWKDNKRLAQWSNVLALEVALLYVRSQIV